jgi:hypothetical protein
VLKALKKVVKFSMNIKLHVLFGKYRLGRKGLLRVFDLFFGHQMGEMLKVIINSF